MTISATASAGLSPSVAGHSFETVGLVHGVEKGNVSGCKTCHVDPGTSTQGTASGFFHTQDVYLKNSPGDTTAADIDNALSLLADPDNSGNGLLVMAYNQITGGTITWDTFCKYRELN